MTLVERMAQAMSQRRRPALFIGAYIGHWLLLKQGFGFRSKNHMEARWYCRCSCGTERWVWANYLQSGKTKSCGRRLAPDLNLFGSLTSAALTPRMRSSSIGLHPSATLFRWKGLAPGAHACGASVGTPNGYGGNPG